MVSPQIKKSFPSPKERLEMQRERELNVDTDDHQFIKFLKYKYSRDYNDWFLLINLGDIKLFNKKMICSITNPANFSSTLAVILFW